MDILNGAVVKERSEAACGFLSCSEHNEAVFLHFFLYVYGGYSGKRFGSVRGQAFRKDFAAALQLLAQINRKITNLRYYTELSEEIGHLLPHHPRNSDVHDYCNFPNINRVAEAGFIKMHTLT